MYNSNTGQNNHQLRLKEQKNNDKMLRKKKSYERLKVLGPLQATNLNETSTKANGKRLLFLKNLNEKSKITNKNSLI